MQSFEMAKEDKKEEEDKESENENKIKKLRKNILKIMVRKNNFEILNY